MTTKEASAWRRIASSSLMILGLLALFVLVAATAIGAANHVHERYELPWGEAFTAVESVATAIALVGAVVAIFLQRSELQEQRREMALQRDEMSLQRHEMELQREEMNESQKIAQDQKNSMLLAAYINAATGLLHHGDVIRQEISALQLRDVMNSVNIEEITNQPRGNYTYSGIKLGVWNELHDLVAEWAKMQDFSQYEAAGALLRAIEKKVSWYSEVSAADLLFDPNVPTFQAVIVELKRDWGQVNKSGWDSFWSNAATKLEGINQFDRM